MKSVLVLIVSALFSTVSFASCEDGHSIAQSAVAGQLRKLHPSLRRQLNCKYTVAEKFAILENGDEAYTVTSVCGPTGSRKTTIYEVVLHEVEDAVCYAKSIRALGAQG